MTAAVICLALLCGGLLYALVHLEDRWAKERNLLISRIQAPEYAPAMAAAEVPTPAPDPTYSEEQEMWELIHGKPVEKDADVVA